VDPTKGNLWRQLNTIERQKLGFIGRLRFVRVRNRLLGPTPTGIIRFHARRAYLQDITRMFLLRCIWKFQPHRIFSIESLHVLLLAVVIVLLRDEDSTALKAMLVDIRETIPWHSIAQWTKEWFVLISFIIILSIVATRSPLVDRIRARDEAAKDVNRLLAQLFGKLSDVEYAATEYLEMVEESRRRIVERAVLKATSNVYTWTYGDGLQCGSLPYWVNEPGISASEQADRLNRACKELSDHLAKYRENGLHTVAAKLTRSISQSLYTCSIVFYNAESSDLLRRRLLVFFDEASQQAPDSVKSMAQGGLGDESGTGALQNANDDVRNYACRLDMRLASAYEILFHLHHIGSVLNRRLHGTTRTRLAGSFVR